MILGGLGQKGGPGGVQTPVSDWFPRDSVWTGRCRILLLVLRFVTIKRKNPIDFGGSRSKGGAWGGPNPRFGLVSAR